MPLAKPLLKDNSWLLERNIRADSWDILSIFFILLWYPLHKIHAPVISASETLVGNLESHTKWQGK